MCTALQRAQPPPQSRIQNPQLCPEPPWTSPRRGAVSDAAPRHSLKCTILLRSLFKERSFGEMSWQDRDAGKCWQKQCSYGG